MITINRTNFFERTNFKIKSSIAISIVQQIFYILAVFFLGFFIKLTGWYYFWILIVLQCFLVSLYVWYINKIRIENLTPNFQEQNILLVISVAQILVLNFFTFIYGLVCCHALKKKNIMEF